MIINCLPAIKNRPGPPLEAVPELLVIHHCPLKTYATDPIEDALLSGSALASRFLDPALGTGGRVPYHCLIQLGGQIDQLLPLGSQGAHAKGANFRSLGIACAGESGAPTRSQWESLVKVCCAMALYTRGKAKLVRHDSLPGIAPGKVCPGRGYDLVGLEHAVRERLPYDWREWPRERVAYVLAAEGWKLSA